MKSFSKWKSFDFDEENTENKAPPKKRIRLNENHSKHPQTTKLTHKTVDFLQEIQPKTVEELMVHNKKVEQLQGWLNMLINNKPMRQKAEFLLITGPTGCGKLTTLQVICKSLDIEIQEYINPVDLDYEIVQRPGQVTRFMEFFDEGKYPSLFNPGRAKLLVVKDFPNAVIRNSREFPDILEEISSRARTAVAFICTDSNNSERDLKQLLFPEDILLKHMITHVSFNACAATLMKKGLKRVTDVLIKHDLCPPVLDDIISSSMGDIRCALNQILLTGMTDKPAKQKWKKPKISQIKPLKDETLGLFHGLGRVLNPKRTPYDNSWRLNCDVGKLVDEFSIQPNKFNLFLFENYIKYFGDFDEIQLAAEVLSFSTQLLENWEHHETLVMGLWISVLGLMVANEHKVSKWNQIRGPKKIDKSVQRGVNRLHPLDQCYFDMINNSDKYHKFNV